MRSPARPGGGRHKLEAASRVSLRDAIFRCDHPPALNPIRAVAPRLGLAVDEREDDFANHADKMIRLMIEISEEKERRARGQFSDVQPYLAAALNRSGGAQASGAAEPASSQCPLCAGSGED